MCILAFVKLFQINSIIFIMMFLFEDFSLLVAGAGLLTNGAYFCLLQTFPILEPTSLPFIASIGKVVDLLLFLLFVSFQLFSGMFMQTNACMSVVHLIY